MNFLKKCFLALTVIGFLFMKSTNPTYAQNYGTEEIKNYDSRVIVNKSGILNVTETITVTANGYKIKHGIYRDFPTLYSSFWGIRTKIPFKVISVYKNETSEPYRIENMTNGLRIYIGDANTLIPSGTYVYRLTYEVGRQIGFFQDGDELFYNITGNGWDFTIEKAQATIVLPEGINSDMVKTDGFTGLYGQKTKNFIATVSTINNQTEATFQTTSPLINREGLTVSVTWPKGYVVRPTENEKFASLIYDNANIIGGAIGTIILFIYYYTVWLKFGRDPKGKVIVARFDPPEEKMSTLPDRKFLSPAVTRFINRMGYDDKCITATIIDGAINNIYKINQKGNDYSIEKINEQKQVSEETNILSDVFFAKYLNVFHFDQKQYAIVASAQSKIRSYLKKKAEETYFIHNYKFIIPAILFSLMVIFYAVVFGEVIRPEGLGIVFWLAIWSLGVVGLISNITSSFKAGKILPAIGLSLFAIPFFIGEMTGIGFLIWIASLPVGLMLIIHIILHAIFFFAMKVRTILGREIQDQIEGLKLYLTTAEKRRYEMLHKTVPETISMYEKYLPYAVALDVEPQWSKLMDEVIKSINAQGQPIAYSPGWYSGTSHFNSLSSFSSGIGGGFTGTISSSAVAPGSSRGGGGGGFSGGGGGGGGGGGW